MTLLLYVSRAGTHKTKNVLGALFSTISWSLIIFFLLPRLFITVGKPLSCEPGDQELQKEVAGVT